MIIIVVVSVDGAVLTHWFYNLHIFLRLQELQLHLGVLQQHAALIGGPNATSCPICHKLFLGGEALMEHMKHTHKDPNASGVASKYPILPGPLNGFSFLVFFYFKYTNPLNLLVMLFFKIIFFEIYFAFCWVFVVSQVIISFVSILSFLF